MKKFVILLLSAAAALLPAAEDALMLFDFENPKQPRRFVTLKGNANKVAYNTNPEYVASGKGSALFYVRITQTNFKEQRSIRKAVK